MHYYSWADPEDTLFLHQELKAVAGTTTSQTFALSLLE
jgi:hypothetical protein